MQSLKANKKLPSRDKSSSSQCDMSNVHPHNRPTQQPSLGLNQSTKDNTAPPQLFTRNKKTRFGTFNCLSLKSSYRQHLLARTLCAHSMDIVCLQETRLRDVPQLQLPSIRSKGRNINYTLYCGNADDQGTGGCAIGVNSRLSSMVSIFGTDELFGHRICWIKMEKAIKRGKRKVPLWIISAHAPTECSDQDVQDSFYEQLDNLRRSIPSGHEVVIGMDGNAQFSKEESAPPLGKHFFPGTETNTNGRRLLDFCDNHNFCLANTQKPHRRMNKISWIGSTKITRQTKHDRRIPRIMAQLDYLLIPRHWTSKLLDAKTCWSVSLSSDHAPVIAALLMPLSPYRKKKKTPRKKFEMLLRDRDINDKYRRKLTENIKKRTRRKETDADSFILAVQDALSVVPDVENRQKNTELSKAAASLLHRKADMRRRGKIKEERRLGRQLRKQLGKDQEKVWERRALEIEEAWNSKNVRLVYNLLKLYSGRIKRNGQLLKKNDTECYVGINTLPVWKNHFSTLLNRPPPTLPPEQQRATSTTYSVGVEEPSEEEVARALKKMKNNKSPGDDGIPAEAFKALSQCGMRDLTKMIQQIWREEKIPDSWRNAIICPIFKKGSPTDTKNYRGISLLRTSFKLVERIIADRIMKCRDKRTREQQAGFRPGRSTIDQIFTLRRTLERTKRYNQNIVVTFLDFEAAFDSPDRIRLFELLRTDGFPEKYINLIIDMNTLTTAAVKTTDGTSELFEVRTGVRQGSVLGPLLFNLVVDDIMRRSSEDQTGISLFPSGDHLLDLEYADDVALLTTSEKTMQEVVDKISEHGRRYGLNLKPSKCKVMSSCGLTRQITVDGEPIELVDHFCYLGSNLTMDGSCQSDIQSRIFKAKSAFNMLYKCLWNTNIDNSTKIRVYNTAIRPILTYAAETWTATPTQLKKIDAAERTFLRRILRIHYPDVISNIELRRRLLGIYGKKATRKSTGLFPLSTVLAERRLSLLGHLLRRPEDHLTKKALEASAHPDWKRGVGTGRRLFWTEIVKADFSNAAKEKLPSLLKIGDINRLWNNTKEESWLRVASLFSTDRNSWSTMCNNVYNGDDAEVNG